MFDPLGTNDVSMNGVIASAATRSRVNGTSLALDGFA
jgi:hypothetical protein